MLQAGFGRAGVAPGSACSWRLRSLQEASPRGMPPGPSGSVVHLKESVPPQKGICGPVSGDGAASFSTALCLPGNHPYLGRFYEGMAQFSVQVSASSSPGGSFEVVLSAFARTETWMSSVSPWHAAP